MTHTEAKHTPGPWWEREPVTYVADVERLKADAADLLAALRATDDTLREVLGELLMLPNAPSNGPTKRERIYGVQRAASDAIAKASRGKA